MTGPLTPPEGVTAKELLKAAKTVERLKLRRRGIVKKLAELDAELKTASRFLRDLAASVASAPSAPPVDGPDFTEGAEATTVATTRRPVSPVDEPSPLANTRVAISEL